MVEMVKGQAGQCPRGKNADEEVCLVSKERLKWRGSKHDKQQPWEN